MTREIDFLRPVPLFHESNLRRGYCFAGTFPRAWSTQETNEPNSLFSTKCWFHYYYLSVNVHLYRFVVNIIFRFHLVEGQQYVKNKKCAQKSGEDNIVEQDVPCYASSTLYEIGRDSCSGMYPNRPSYSLEFPCHC